MTVSPGPRARFLEAELCQLTLAAGLQRSSTYLPDAPEPQRTGFRASLREYLRTIVPRYSGSVSDAEHVGTLEELATEISGQHGGCLAGGRLRLGVAQKCLNLYLKYLWCAGWAHMPPHCPFDAVIMRRLPTLTRVPWTRLDTVDQYLGLVEAARVVAGNRSLAEWELEEYELPRVSRRPGK